MDADLLNYNDWPLQKWIIKEAENTDLAPGDELSFERLDDAVRIRISDVKSTNGEAHGASWIGTILKGKENIAQGKTTGTLLSVEITSSHPDAQTHQLQCHGIKGDTTTSSLRNDSGIGSACWTANGGQ